jgi:hypothetical protein
MKQTRNNNDHEQPNVFLGKDHHGDVIDSSNYKNYRGTTGAPAAGQGGQEGVTEARVITASTSNNTSVSTITTENSNMLTNEMPPSSRREINAGERNVVLLGEHELTNNDQHLFVLQPPPQLHDGNSCTSSPSTNRRHNISSSVTYTSRKRVPAFSSPSSSRKLHATSVVVQDEDDMNSGGTRSAVVRDTVEEDSRPRQEMRGRKRSISSTSIPEDRPHHNSFSNSNESSVNRLGSSSNRSTMINSRGEVNYQDQHGIFVRASDFYKNGTIMVNRLNSNNYVMSGMNGTVSSVPREITNQGTGAGPHHSVSNHQGGEMTGDPHRYGTTTYIQQPSFPMPSNSISIAPTIFKAHQIMVNSPHPGDFSHLSAAGASSIYHQGGIKTGAPSVGQTAFLNSNVQLPATNQLQEGLQFIGGNNPFTTQQNRVDSYHSDGQIRGGFQAQQQLYQLQQHNPLSNSAIPVQWMNYHSSIPSDPYATQSAFMAAQQQQRQHQQQAIPPAMLVPSQMIHAPSVQQPFLMNNSYASGYAHGLMSATSSSMPSSIEFSSSTAGRPSDSLQHNGLVSNGNRESKSNSRGAANHQGRHLTDHHSNRKVRTLETSGDSIWLSDFLCFLRRECCEVFTATAKDVQERRKSKQINLNQVGIRCRFCAHLPHNIRVGRSSCFPSSVDRIYQSVTMMIREHFPICEQFPDDVRRKYIFLKKSTKKGEMESKAHWRRAARELGMVDTPNGIYFESDLIGTEKQPKHQEEDNNFVENDSSVGDEGSSVGKMNQHPSGGATPEVDNMTAL